MDSNKENEEENLNEEEEEEEDEIIDNNDDDFGDSPIRTINSSKFKNNEKEEIIQNDKIKNENSNLNIINENIDNKIKENKNEVGKKQIKLENKQQKDNINKNEMKVNNNNNNINLDNYSKEDLLALLINNPINIDDVEEDREEKIKLNLNLNSKIPEEQEKEEDSDFHKALSNVLTKISKNKNPNNNELYELLVKDKDVVENELKKYHFNKKINISSKIQNYLDKKNKNLNEIKQKKEEEFKQKYTFAPLINKKKDLNNKKRNLNQFLKAQEEYQQKINEKITNMKDSQIKKEEEQLKLKPKIQTNSEKMAQEKYKGEEVFKRLYNQTPKKNIEKEVKKQEKNSKNNQSNVNEEYLNNLYQDAKNREKKNKEKEDLENKKRKEAITYKAASNSNKYLFNKFKNAFKNQIEIILSENENGKKLDLNQLKELFINLNFISIFQTENETNLLNEIYETLKDEEDLISIDHIFIFCLSILSLFEYYILSNYQMNNNNNNSNTIDTESNDNQREIINSSSQKHLKYNNSSNKLLQKNYSLRTVGLNDDVGTKLDIINKDLASRIINNAKFGGFDSENNFIITCNSAKLISKYFISFYQNYNNPNLNKEDNPRETNNNKNKPLKRISASSNKIKNQEKNFNKLPNNSEIRRKNKSNTNSKRIEQLYLESKKKKNQLEKEKEKYLEKKEKEEKKICTFKPRINSNSQYRTNVIPVGENNNPQELRMELLYKKGTENLLNKKDKTNDEIEVEKYKNELTFKPNINEINYEVFKRNNNIDNYEVQKFNQRLQKGREERELRESALERGEFFIQNPRNVSDKKNVSKKRDFGFSEAKKKNLLEKNIYDSNLNYINNHENENPILQIDVNLKHGMQKKVYVYEGDTAENLAKDFCIENGLDDKMRKKLQALIQQEIDKVFQIDD